MTSTIERRKALFQSYFHRCTGNSNDFDFKLKPIFSHNYPEILPLNSLGISQRMMKTHKASCESAIIKGILTDVE